jgi:hypothetical protein
MRHGSCALAIAVTQDASRAGPRFPFRTFDPTNPDRRRRAVGRFYAADLNALACALTRERWAKALR